MANLGADITSNNISKGYIEHGKSKINSAIHGTEENNMHPSQTTTSDDNEEALAGAATTFSELSPPTDN